MKKILLYLLIMMSSSTVTLLAQPKPKKVKEPGGHFRVYDFKYKSYFTSGGDGPQRLTVAQQDTAGRDIANFDLCDARSVMSIDNYYFSWEQFDDMVKYLGLSPDTPTEGEAIDMVRVYPALTRSKPVKVYLVFFKDQRGKDDVSRTDTTKACMIDIDGVGLVPIENETDLTKARVDIRRFQNRYGNTVLALKSFCFTVHQTYAMREELKKFHYPDPDDLKGYGIRFCPAWDDSRPLSKLYFLMLDEYRVSPSRRILYEDHPWFDQNSPCPSDCPEDELKAYGSKSSKPSKQKKR